MKHKDLRIEFHANNMELEIPEFCGSLNKFSCHGAIDFVTINYRQNKMVEHLKEKILHYYKTNENKDVAIDLIISDFCRMMLKVLPERNLEELESRLIFYLPENESNHPEIMKYVHNKRIKDESGVLIEEPERDQEMIYLNFNEHKRYMSVSVFHKKDIPLVREILKNGGFEPIVNQIRLKKVKS